MELRHLRYFYVVAAERNFTRAAAKLNMAQPPLSRQIRDLEAELGAALFVRGSRPLELTEAGRVLLEHATQVLDRIEDIRTGIRALGSTRKIAYPIGFVGSTIYGALPRALRRFRVARPDLDVRLIEMTTLEQLSALDERWISIGFGRLRFSQLGLTQRVLREEPLVVALSADSPLASGGDPLPLAALLAEPLVIYPRKPRPSFADQVLGIFRDRGLAPGAVVEAGELQTALGHVASGAGLCLIPESVSGLRGDIAYRRLAEPGVTSPIIATTRAGERSEATDALLALLVEELGAG
jgi:DNA-binding transcriptional LysR family regulator